MASMRRGISLDALASTHRGLPERIYLKNITTWGKLWLHTLLPNPSASQN